MKVIEETKKIYIANDGERFDTEKKCLDYENLFQKQDGVYFLLTVGSDGNYPVGIFESFSEAKIAKSKMKQESVKENRHSIYAFRIYRIQKNNNYETKIELYMEENTIELSRN